MTERKHKPEQHFFFFHFFFQIFYIKERDKNSNPYMIVRADAITKGQHVHRKTSFTLVSLSQLRLLHLVCLNVLRGAAVGNALH